MQLDNDVLEIMNRYKPGSADALQDTSPLPAEQNAGASDEEIEEEFTPHPQSPPTDAGGTVAATPPAVAVDPSKQLPSDKDALAVINSRFEFLWKLEADHEKLKQEHASLEQAKSEVEKQRNEWEQKSNERDGKIEQLNKELEGEKDKYKALEKKFKEMEDANAKLTHKLEAEKERYTLLSGQFEELNNKLVEIVTNVTHMKTDEIPKPRSPRKNEPATPTAKPQAGFAGFFSSSSTPTKPAPAGAKPPPTSTTGKK